MSPRATRPAKDGAASPKDGAATPTGRRRPALPGRGRKGAASKGADAALAASEAAASGEAGAPHDEGEAIVANGARWAAMQRTTATTAPHVAMPHLMGQPAYARPPRPLATETPRPFDPDDLPIEAFRSEEDRVLAEHLVHARATHASSTLEPSTTGGLRGIAGRFFGSRG